MLLEGIPFLSAASPAHPTAAAPKAPADTTKEPLIAASHSSPTKQSVGGSVTIPLSEQNTTLLCSLGVLPTCAEHVNEVSVPAAPVPDPALSSWTNITPPEGVSNIYPVESPAMSYFPAGHENILFGGLGLPPNVGFAEDLQNTWSFVDNHWTELISNATCTPSTCPAPRDSAMMTYYPPDNALLLFGGTNYSAKTESESYFNDTWLFENGAWTNITATAGTPPSARFDSAMIWDPYLNAILLFGGLSYQGLTLGDTWFFYEGTWLNFTGFFGGTDGYETSLAPEPRYEAAIAEDPSGNILLYGGSDAGTVIENNCDVGLYYAPGDSTVAWWFNQTGWYPMNETEDSCVPITAPYHPTPPSSPGAVEPGLAATDPGCGDAYPGDLLCSATIPCGRTGPTLGWSIKNNRFVLYGGDGPNDMAACSGDNYLNDTWLFRLPAMSHLTDEAWGNVSDSGDPSGRYITGYVTDYTDNYFEIAGGNGNNALGYNVEFNSTYRFYAIVHARMSGPADIYTSGEHFTSPITIDGYGGSGVLDYEFLTTGIRNSNTLSGTGCGQLTSGDSYALPYDGEVNINCYPTEGSYNVYRLTVEIYDTENTSDYALANLVFTVIPPETEVIYSEYQTFFYTGVDFDNTFTIDAVVAGGPASSIDATLGGSPVSFSQESNPDLWSYTPNMGNVAPGAIIQAEAFFNGWTLNATYSPAMVSTPFWLQTLFAMGSNRSISTQGAGPYNKTYTIDQDFDWNLGQALGFDLPIPLVSGDYSLIPSLKVTFSADSMGDISIEGSLALNPPSIDFGAFSLSISAAFNLTGTFGLTTSGSDVTGIQWLSATATVTVSGDFSGSVPLYGFSILGVTIGFVLDVSINPSITLKMILAPTSNPADELISGLGVKISQFFGSFTLPLSVSVNFGIGIASVGIGGSISVAVQFVLNPGFTVAGGWVNGTIFVQAQALFWSTSWNLVSGTIYEWGSAGAELAALALDIIPYNNGTGVPWSINSRYYVGPGYDKDVWSPSASQGPAVSDIYPYTEVTGAAGYNGAYLFYSDDNSSLSPAQGLGITGQRLDASTNALLRVPVPSVPNFVISNPKATTLPDGNLYVVWEALPVSEAGLASPLDVTSLDLQGAEFFTGSQTWGSVTTWSSSGIPESYQVDATGSTGQIIALMSTSLLLGDSTPEHLVEYDIASGKQLADLSLSGISEVVGLRGASSEALLLDFGGNYTTIQLTTGDRAPVPFAPPFGYALMSAAYVVGSASTLVLLYRGNQSSELVLYDLALSQTIAYGTVAGDTSGVQAVADGTLYYVIASTVGGLAEYTELVGPFQNLTTVDETGIDSFGVVQAGSSILVYSIATTGGNTTEPIKELELAEVAASLPIVPGRPSPSTTPAGESPTDLAIYLGIVAVADAAVLAVLAIRGRRPPRQITAVPAPAAGAPEVSTPAQPPE